MAKLDLKGRKIADIRVIPSASPEEPGQLELRLDDWKTVAILRQPCQDMPETYSGIIVEIDGEVVYRHGKTSHYAAE